MSSTPVRAAGMPGDAATRTVIEGIDRSGLVAILDAPTAIHFSAVTGVLVDAGVRVIEVTLTTAGALACVAELADTYAGQQHVLIGAGTVVTADQAEQCIEAGACFVASPVASPDVIAAARVAHVAAVPGALSPTEILAAQQSGADAVMVFPASAVRPPYLGHLRGPLPAVPLIPSGGIAIDQIGGWISAGATAVGLGGHLLRDTCESGTGMAGLADRARRSLSAIAGARGTDRRCCAVPVSTRRRA